MHLKSVFSGLSKFQHFHLSSRHFYQSSIYQQKTVSKSSVRFAKPKKNSKRKSKSKPYEAKVQYSGDSMLDVEFKRYLENLILGTYEEMECIKMRERLMNSRLPDEILEIRGLCINNLVLQKEYLTSNNNNQEFNIKFAREGGQSLPVGGWRSGMLVTVVLDTDSPGYSDLESWRKIDGILVEVTSENIVVGISNLSGWILDSLLGFNQDGNIKILKRSEVKLYSNNIKRLKDILKYPVDFSKNAPAKFIFENALNVDGNEKNLNFFPSKQQQILTVYNKKLLSDVSKKRALHACSQCNPVTIIQGPPGRETSRIA